MVLVSPRGLLPWHESILAHSRHFFFFAHPHGLTVLRHLILHAAVIVCKTINNARLAIIHQ